MPLTGLDEDRVARAPVEGPALDDALAAPAQHIDDRLVVLVRLRVRGGRHLVDVHAEDPVVEAEIAVDEPDLPVAPVLGPFDRRLRCLQQDAGVAPEFLPGLPPLPDRELQLAHPFLAADVADLDSFAGERMLGPE